MDSVRSDIDPWATWNALLICSQALSIQFDFLLIAGRVWGTTFSVPGTEPNACDSAGLDALSVQECSGRSNPRWSPPRPMLKNRALNPRRKKARRAG
jgi:hypothetical protein